MLAPKDTKRLYRWGLIFNTLIFDALLHMVALDDLGDPHVSIATRRSIVAGPVRYRG
jgi:hypothetical protein